MELIKSMFSKKSVTKGWLYNNGQKIGDNTISGAILDTLWYYSQGDILIGISGNNKFMARRTKDAEIIGVSFYDTEKAVLYTKDQTTAYAVLLAAYNTEAIKEIKSLLQEKYSKKNEETITKIAKLTDDFYYWLKDNDISIETNVDSLMNINIEQKDKQEQNITEEEIQEEISTIINLDHEMSSEELNRVPVINDKIVIPAYVKTYARIIAGEIEGENPIKNILWYGPAGTGKSFSTRLLAKELGLPHYQFVFSKNTDEISMVSGADVSDGTVTYNDSEIVECCKNGGVIEFQEFYNASPDVLTFLNQFLEEGYLRLANGKIIKRHPKCIVVATSNINYASCQDIDFSVDSRFTVQEFIGDVSDEELSSRIKFKSGVSDETIISKLIQIYRNLNKWVTENEYDEGICCPRKLIAWAQLSKYNKDLIACADKTILSGLSKNQDVRLELIESILKPIL